MTKKSEKQYHIYTRVVSGGEMCCYMEAKNISDALEQEINWNSRGRNSLSHIEYIHIEEKEEPPC